MSHVSVLVTGTSRSVVSVLGPLSWGLSREVTSLEPGVVGREGPDVDIAASLVRASNHYHREVAPPRRDQGETGVTAVTMAGVHPLRVVLLGHHPPGNSCHD